MSQKSQTATKQKIEKENLRGQVVREEAKSVPFPRSLLSSGGRGRKEFLAIVVGTRHTHSVMCLGHAERQYAVRDLLVLGRRCPHSAAGDKY